MSKTPIKLDDKALSKNSDGLLCALKFITNKKKNYAHVIDLCKRADSYAEVDGQHAVMFYRTKEGARLAAIVIEEMRIAGWKFTIFANGQIQTNKFRLVNMLDCYSTASSMRNPKAHCHYVIEDPYNDADPEDTKPPTMLVHCQYAKDFFNLPRRNVDPDSAFEAAAIERCANLCPAFKPIELKVTTGVKGPKRYW